MTPVSGAGDCESKRTSAKIFSAKSLGLLRKVRLRPVQIVHGQLLLKHIVLVRRPRQPSLQRQNGL